MKTPLLLALVIILLIQFSTTFHIQTSNREPTLSQYNSTISRDYTILAVTSYCDKKCL